MDGKARRLVTILTALGVLGAAVGVKGVTLVPPASAGQGMEQVQEGAKTTGRAVEETAKGVGNTVSEGAEQVGERAKQAEPGAKAVGKELHERAKGFGEAILDGFKFTGRTIANFFTGNK